MSQKIKFTTPVGRIVQGSLYTPKTTDAEGKPLVVKTGPNAGQPRVDYYIALAIPKFPGQTHWAQKPPTWDQEQAALGRPGNRHWGEAVWQTGHGAFPQAAGAPDFAWKIIDGDSQQLGKLFKGKPGKPPCQNEGFPGHWILKISGGFAPKVYRQEGGGFVQDMTPDFVKCGHFVEVSMSVAGNGSQTSPGVYLNHELVCFRAYGPEIVGGPDVEAAGFGMAALPAGASMTPLASAAPLPAAAPQAMPAAPGVAMATPLAGIPPVPGANVMPQAAIPGPVPVPAYPGASAGASPAYAPSVPAIPINGMVPPPLVPAGSVPMPSAPVPVAAAPIPVMPNTGFVQVMPPAAVPAVPAAPVAAAPVRQMTAAAQGASYEQLIANGWTDATLVQNGLMLA